MDKCNYENIDWSECPFVDIENVNRHVMDVELTEEKYNSEKETITQNSTKKKLIRKNKAI